MFGYIGNTVFFGVLGLATYINREKITNLALKFCSMDFDNFVLSTLFPRTVQTVGSVGITSVTIDGEIYYYPIILDADCTSSIGHRLRLVKGYGTPAVTYCEINPPPGARFEIDTNILPDDVKIELDGEIVQYVSWPPSEEPIIEE